MDRTKATNLIQIVFSELKKRHAELRAYEIAFGVLKATLEPAYPGFADLADGGLAAARVSPALHEAMRKQYDEPLERFLQQVSQAETDEEVEKLLLAMPTSTFVN